MEILKIENGLAKYRSGEDYCDIKTIGRDELLKILATIYQDDNATIINPGADAESIQDPAAKIIFINILEKLNEFYDKRDELKNDIGSIFKDAEEQYKDDLKSA